MQIHRIDIPSGGDTSRTSRTPVAYSDRGMSLTVSRENEAEGAVGGRELERLSRHLDEISDVRPDVIAEAKVRVQRGDYLTRAVAEKTAAAILSKDV